MSLRIHLLGQFNLQANDLPLELPSRPAQSLLAYLALNAGIAQRREKLASLLWPEAAESNARSYLRQALWRIRKSLTGASLDWQEYLQINDITVAFDGQSDYWLDAAVLLEPADARPTEEIISIVRLYRGELLPGFYDEWVVLERDRLQAAYQQKMNLLLERLVEAGRWDDVVQWSEQWIRLGHAPEPAYRALLRAHAGLGNQGMIGATYQRCIDTLERELDVEPSPETQRLYERIRRQELGDMDTSTTLITGKASQCPPFLDDGERQPTEAPIFVARQRELARLDNFLNLALAGQGQVIFITGEAGGGKTALLYEFSRRAQEAHADLIIAGGNCNAHTGIGDPYLPFREILELLTGDVESRWTAGAISRDHALRLWQTLPLSGQALTENGIGLIDTFLPGAALIERATAAAADGADWLARLRAFLELETGATVLQGSRQDLLFEQVTKVLQALARQVPLVLMVDDLQWADLGSISLLFHLGRNLRGSRILIAGAYRPEEVSLGRDKAQHPLKPVVNELKRDFGDIVVNVDQAESRDFVSAILDSESNRLEIPFREMLYRQTRGNPLFTVELLRGMQARGDLVQDEAGQWVEGPELNWEMLPARVEAVIAQRVGRLRQEMQDALRIASVEGETFTAEVVAHIQGTAERDMVGQLSRALDRKHRLISAHTIQRTNGQLLSRYRFRHIQIQKYLYSSLDEVERVHLHEQVGTVLETLYADEERLTAVSLQLARHFQEAKITTKVIHYLHLAGKNAVQLSAYQEGVTHLTKALSLLMTLPVSSERAEQELELQLSMGVALMHEMPGPKRFKAYTRARELCRQLGKTSQLCRILGELSIFHYVRSEHLLALELAEEAYNLSQQDEDPRIAALGAWYLGLGLFATGNYTAARAHFAQTTSFYEPDLHHQFYVDFRGADPGLSALAYDALCLWCLGYPDQALKRSQDTLSLGHKLDHPFSLADVLCFAGCMFNIMIRDVAAAKDNAQQLIYLTQEIRLRGWLGAADVYWGEALTMQGQFQEGITRIEQGELKRLSTHVWCYSTGVRGALALAYANTGRLQLGLSTIDKALTRVEESDERHSEAELRRLQAELLLMNGDEAQAEASLQQSIVVARRQRAKSWELRAVISLARLWQKQGQHDQARRRLEQIYSWFTEGHNTADLREARTLLEKLNLED